MTAYYNPKGSQGINRSHRKENAFQESYLVMAIVDGKIKNIIDCRIYGTQAANYCCVWVKRQSEFNSGSGKASGYGYHRPSQAVSYAIDEAGYKLSEDIGGRGDNSIEGALLAIAELEGYPNAEIFKAHA